MRVRGLWTPDDDRANQEAASRVPPYLYRYLPLPEGKSSDASERRRQAWEAIETSSVHFASWPRFSDPFDCTANLKTDAEADDRGDQ